MNREIKFRAWVKSKDSMVDVTAIEQTPDEEYPHGWIACPWEQGFNESIDTQEKDCVFKTEDVVLMQYTGLKDRNGKEIYEGDIVKWDSVGLGVIGWLSCGFSHDQRNKRSPIGVNHLHPNYTEEYEVIGNIYENPELLKEGKK
jgi:hypothetical protein